MFEQALGLGMTGTETADVSSLVNFTQPEKEKFMANVMSLSPKLRDLAIHKVLFLDKKISEMKEDRARVGKKFFTDEMASDHLPDPRLSDGGNSYEVENKISIALHERGDKVWDRSQEMKQKLITSPREAVLCVDCQNMIDKDRNEEVPHTRHCVACKNSHNGNGHNGNHNGK